MARSSRRLATKLIRLTKRSPATSRPQRLARISPSSASTAGARPQASRSATTAPDNGGGRAGKGNQEKLGGNSGEALKIARGCSESDP